MKKVLGTLALLSAAGLWVTGCGGSSATSSASGTEAMADAAPVEIQGQEMTVELGCGACIYEMEGVTKCTTAAKVGDATMLVVGGDIDAHSAGLCEAARDATVVGEVKDGKLYVSSITLL